MFLRSFLIAVTLVMVAASPASAGDERSASIGSTTLGDGYVEVSGTGCEPNIPVHAAVTPALFAGIKAPPSSPPSVAEGEAEPDGTFELRTPVGAEAGEYVTTVTCGALVQTLEITLTDEALPQNAEESSVPLVRLGLVLMTIGGLAVYAARRRRQPLIRS